MTLVTYVLVDDFVDGQPPFEGKPASFGHLSFASATPSPSESNGQPLFEGDPAMLGHLSFTSATPSPSVSTSEQP
jgi:hypothetical protein